MEGNALAAWVPWVSLASGLLAATLAVVVLRAGRGRRINRRLAGLLAIDAAFQLTLGVPRLAGFGGTVGMDVAGSAAAALTATAFLLFTSGLETPLARPLRTAAGRGLVLAVGAVSATGAAAVLLGADDPAIGQQSIYEAAPWMYLALASLLALAFSLDAFRRTARGSLAHRRAGAVAAAFGVRDGMYACGILVWGVAEGLGRPAVQSAAELISTTGTLAFSFLLAIGILRTQVFDIDLKLKVGIQRGTLASVLVGGFFAVYKVTEFWLGREYGFMFGGVLSGVFFFLAPRLNKMADKAADKVMPQVQPTPEYLAYKKMEVYRAAVESALEDGEVDERERALLATLRAKLGIRAADAEALERELSEGRAA